MDVLAVVGVIVGVAAIPTAYFFGRRNRQRPDLRMSLDFDQIFAPRSFGKGLQLAWNGGSLEKISRTNIAIWNHRGDTVRGLDILPTDPLRVVVEDDDVVLQVRVVSYSRPQVGFALSGDGVTFDFLDPGDGAIIEVLHEGDSPARLAGTIPGAAITTVAPSNLAPAARRQLRSGPVRRLFAKSRRRLTVLLLAALVLGVAGLVAGTQLLLWLINRAPEMVDINLFDLTTLEGQSLFSDEVSRVGALSPLGQASLYLVIGLVVLYGTAVVALLSRLAIRMRTTVPRSIATVDEDAPAE